MTESLINISRKGRQKNKKLQTQSWKELGNLGNMKNQ